MGNKNRALYLFQYLWDHTDEEHPATTADMIQYLASCGIATTRKTVAEDAAELQNCGFDVVVNRSRQNEFFIGTRYFEIPELKLLDRCSTGGEVYIYAKKFGVNRQNIGTGQPISPRGVETQSFCTQQDKNRQ